MTGLSVKEGKSSTLGERISGGAAPCCCWCFRGEKSEGRRGLIRRFLKLLWRRSQSLKAGRLGPFLLAGREGFPDMSEEPVSIWTTCLKEELSACTKVVG